jgi:hypothetical protein
MEPLGGLIFRYAAASRDGLLEATIIPMECRSGTRAHSRRRAVSRLARGDLVTAEASSPIIVIVACSNPGSPSSY